MRSRTGFRFRPPPGPLPPEVAAAVRLALTRGALDPGGEAEPEAIWRVAGALGLREAMAARVESLPAAGAAGSLRNRLLEWRRRTVARELLHEAAARQVAAAAAELSVPIVWLKGFALRSAGLHPPGRRALQDLDLLARPRQATTLERHLAQRGWRRSGGAGNEQHLAPLQSPDGCWIDIHFRLRGVRLRGNRWAEAGEILERPGTRPAAGLEGTFLPEPGLLAAHLSVHALAQHGHRPSSYPLLRAVDDLAALLPGEREWRRFASGWVDAIGGAVSPRELEALGQLVVMLPAGRLPEAGEDRDAHRLLRHALAGATDRRYARSLRRRHLGGRVREAFSEGHLAAYLRRKLRSRRLG